MKTTEEENEEHVLYICKKNILRVDNILNIYLKDQKTTTKLLLMKKHIRKERERVRAN